MDGLGDEDVYSMEMFFIEWYGDNEDLNRGGRRQSRMSIRDRA